MTVARKAQLGGQCGQIVVLRNQVQRSGEAQPQLIAIEGNAFGLLEHLCQIYRRAADFRGDVRERPAPGKIAGQQDFDAVSQPAARTSRSGFVRCAWAQASANQGEHEALGLQRLDGAVVQAMPKQGDQGLCARVDAVMLPTESELSAIIQK
jgi:hypothetical protein